MKKGKSSGFDKIKAELIQAGGENIVDVLTKISNKMSRTGEWPTPWTQSLIITFPKRAAYCSVITTDPSALSASKSC